MSVAVSLTMQGAQSASVLYYKYECNVHTWKGGKLDKYVRMATTLHRVNLTFNSRLCRVMPAAAVLGGLVTLSS